MDVFHNFELVEIFHLTFLRFFEQVVPKQHYVLKGGCNLRFFFKSIRYSEDIDFDIRVVLKQTLQKNVTKLLLATNFRATLASLGIHIAQFSSPKQTDTTQRWKVQLQPEGRQTTLSTKIEFSRRNRVDEQTTEFESVDRELVARYRLSPVFVTHYNRAEAFHQKLLALLGRSETQVRDVFDLYQLLSNDSLQLPRNLSSKVEAMKEKILSIDFDMFSSQVIAFLEPSYLEHYGEEEWDQMRMKVIQQIESLQ